MVNCTGGMDVHARSVQIAVVRGDELVGERTLGYELADIEQQLREWGVTRCCYEAGPTGFELQRHLAAVGFQDRQTRRTEAGALAPGADADADRGA